MTHLCFIKKIIQENLRANFLKTAMHTVREVPGNATISTSSCVDRRLSHFQLIRSIKYPDGDIIIFYLDFVCQTMSLVLIKKNHDKQTSPGRWWVEREWYVIGVG